MVLSTQEETPLNYKMVQKMKQFFLLTTALIFVINIHAQENLPTDYLSKSFHQGRREAFREKMPANSVAVIFAFPERTFSNDVDYVFHQNPDLYYLTGYKEPDAVLLLFKEQQPGKTGQYNELFFVRQRDATRETWTGRRLGDEGVKSKLGISNAYNGKDFNDFGVDFKKFSTVIYEELPEDVKRDGSGFDLYGLMQTFKKSVSQPAEQDKILHRELQRIGTYANASNMQRLIALEKQKAQADTILQNNPIITEFLGLKESAGLPSVKDKIKLLPKWGTDIYREITVSLREIKTPEEVVLMKKTVQISCLAHTEVMRAVTPQMSEREAEGIQLYMHKKNGAEDEGYPAIVGAGGNGCILHYEENSALKIDNQLLLMDVGSEYHGYSADVTRTVPANGKFSDEQKAIYNLVYDAQEAVFTICKEGTPFENLNKKATEILTAGLINLGIIKTAEEVRKYYPHGCSHHLGLDVHDKSAYGELKENMVITVEPGIYIPAGSPCDKKWWNIGVRIEDDVLILKNSFDNLSASAPRKLEDVEKMAAQKSSFNDQPK